MGRRRKKISPFDMDFQTASVKDLLTQMKDKSELIVDLAYSAIIFNSQNMKAQVFKLEEEMDFLLYQIRLQAMLAARTKKDAQMLSGILQVASAAETMSDAAGDIASLMDSGSQCRFVLPFVLRKADERIEMINVEPDSTMIGKRLKELKVEEETGARIIAIKRKIKWIYGPGGKQKINKNDLLIVRGVSEGIEELKHYCVGKMKWGTYQRRDPQ